MVLGIVVRVTQKVDQNLSPRGPHPRMSGRHSDTERMANSNGEHRPLRRGLWIRTAKTNDSGGLDVIQPGTLTGLARRVADQQKVLVTNQHVMTVHARDST